MTEKKSILDPQKWVEIYADELFGYAMSKTGNSSLSEDLVQDSFLGALKSQANFKGNSSERTWLFSILKFKIADHYRKPSTKNEISNEQLGKGKGNFLENFFDEDENWKENANPESWDSATNNALENKELRIALAGCINKLPAQQKNIITLKLVDEEKTEVICKELNISTTNYWVIIHRAKLALRTCLEKNWIKA